MSPWFRKLWNVLWPVLGNVSLRVKIMGIALMMISILGLGLTVQTRITVASILRQELEQRGLSIARDLAARSTDMVLTNNLYNLYTLIRETVQNNSDVRYAFVLDARGDLLAHSFEGGFPSDLLTVNRLREGAPYQSEIIQTEEGLIQDIAVPIFGQYAGTAHVGMSYRRQEQIVAGLTRQFLLTTLAVSLMAVGLSSLMTWLLTRPVQALTEATRRVGEGDLSPRLTPWSADEIGYLQESFNTMVERLARARQEMAAVNERLLRRNRELFTLYQVSQTLAGPLELETALQTVLRQAVTTVGARGGWVCLAADGHSDCRTCATFWQDGALPFLVDRCPRCVACERVRAASHLTVLISTSSGCLSCPLLREEETASPVYHIAIPLQVKDETLGLLNVVCQDELCQEDLRLLETVGRQMGVGIENAHLWKELRRKEAVRRELLRKAIAAQEEERRRIARELHDEASQAMAALLVSLRLIENAPSLEEARAQVARMREVVNQTLDEIRALAWELRPSVLDDLGLVPALARYIQGCRSRFGMEIDLEVVGLDQVRLPPEVETALYRIAQEALTNAARHAGARHVSVILEQRGNRALLIVEDDGEGFDVAKVRASAQEQGHLGLYGMEERASLVGGRLTVESAPRAGTTVVVEVPLA
ncbi:MAG: ATP-binding protein [Anaerolineae bacterium]